VLALLCGTAHTTDAAPIDSIQNGGFEAGDFSGWSAPTYNPNPWFVTSDRAGAGVYSAYNPALDSALAATTLYQTFAPIAVERIVRADFWYFHEGGPGTVGLASLLTFDDGTFVQDTLFAADPEYRQGVWTRRDLTPTLRAHRGKHLVQIGFFPKLLGEQYIDDVSIRVVPEPATGALALAALIAAFTWRTRARR
jgi:hypothetical protein